MTGGDVEEEVVDPVAASSGGVGELFAVISAAWPASGVVDAVFALPAAPEFPVDHKAVDIHLEYEEEMYLSHSVVGAVSSGPSD